MIEKSQREQIPSAMYYVQERVRRIPELSATIHPSGPGHFRVAERGILALVSPERLRRILTRMLDENEFPGPHGIRSISKFHERNPYVLHVDGQEYRVDYLPAESNTGMFGGNSNWRGPVWMPVKALIIRALQNFYLIDPHWRDYILFYEYFHADNGAGLGASHQTGWTGLVATLIELNGRLDAARVLEAGKKAAFDKGSP